MVNGVKNTRLDRINGHVRPTVGANQVVKDGEVDLQAIEGAVRTILRAVGENPDRAGLLDTPRRVARMYKEMFAGFSGTRRDTSR